MDITDALAKGAKLKPLNPIEPSKKTVTTKVTDKNGKVVIQYSEPISTYLFDPNAAIEFGRNLIQSAKKARR